MMPGVAIESAGSARLADVVDFIRSWSEDDSYERFGILGSHGPAWLAAELCDDSKRHAIIASAGRHVVGLLDHIEAEGAVHFGIVVDARYRRLYVGTELVNELLRMRSRDRAVSAECRASNYAAIALLRRCGFERVTMHHDEVVWCHP